MNYIGSSYFKGVKRNLSMSKKESELIELVCKKLGMKVSHFFLMTAREYIRLNLPELFGRTSESQSDS